MLTIKGLRWWTIGLIMLGSSINYLTRSTLAVAAPTILQDLQSHCFSAATVTDFEPERFQQMAGLICYYNGSKYHYFCISCDDTLGKHLRVMSCLRDLAQPDVFSDPIAIPRGAPVHLRVEVDYERLLFAYRVEGEDWVWMRGLFDAGILSDESGPAGKPNFRGAFAGIFCQDLTEARGAADFDYFYYQGRDYLPDPKKMAFPI